MTKALFKKQMMEVFSWVYRDKKTGKNRSTVGMVLFILLYLALFAFLGVMFYFAAEMLCTPLVSVGLGWLYFALMGLMAVALGVFGSVFNTYAGLYQAKDNDMLLAMPIPPARILLIRLSGVYAMGLMYELIIMIPAVIVWFMQADVGILGIICTLLIPLALSVFVLILSAVLGWVVALISGRLKNKNVIVVFLSLAFIAAYYYFYANAYSLLEGVLAHPQEIGKNIKTALYPLYHMGLAAEGKVLSMLIFAGIVGALFAVVYLVLAHSFLKISTTNKGTVKVKRKRQQTKVHSVKSTLLGKEFKRFLGSANYMLNCGLGIILMPVAAVFLLVKSHTVQNIISEVFVGEYAEIIYIIMAAAICVIATMNDMTAPSVSLEGKNIWLVQVFPVSGRQVLMAKLKLHLILTLVPAAVLTAAAMWVIRPTLWFAILIPVTVVLFILLMAEFGLFLNLKMPNLTWSSENVPVKQSLGVMIALFGGWVLVALLGMAYYFLYDIFAPIVFLSLAAVVLFVLSAVLWGWIRTRGAAIFETL